jgi:AcrR family transcriptional regulator
VSRPKGSRDTGHEAKRQDLLASMTLHMVRRDGGRASLRELATAAGVSVPTLRHYFGDRSQTLDAVMAECLRRGRPGLDAQRHSDQPFSQSIRDYAEDLMFALSTPKTVRLGDVFAISLAEGFLDPQLGPSALSHIVDPTIEALQARLALHVQRGEMIATDLRAAALVLASPLLLASLHQQQLCGQQTSPLAMNDLVEDVVAAFLRAFAAPPCVSDADALETLTV